MATALVEAGLRFPDDSTQTTAIQQGIIIMWDRPIVDIPAGYQLCDGTNGTPDLRNMFVIGAGGLYNVGDTGGADSVTVTAPQLPSHSHPYDSWSISPANSHAHNPRATSTNPNHNHPFNGTIRRPGPIVTAGTGAAFGTINASGAGGPHSHPVSYGTDGGHSHPISISVANFGGGDSHENRPPYHSLAFIMEIA